MIYPYFSELLFNINSYADLEILIISYIIEFFISIELNILVLSIKVYYFIAFKG